MKITVIIVTHNAEKWIASCFNSLRNNSINFKTIVIDNASKDSTTDILQKEYPEVELIKSTVNLGFGAANNIGISKAYKEKCDFVFLLNQDAYVEFDTIEKLCKLHQQNLDYGILSPMQFADSGNVIDSKFLNYISEKKYNSMISDLIVGKEVQPVYPFRFINAAVWSVSRKCLETVGGFDPLFFHYGEDDDYCQRLHEKGLKIGVAPKVYAVHNRSQIPSIQTGLNYSSVYKNYLLKLKNMNSSLLLNYIKQFLASLKLVLVCLIRFNFSVIWLTILMNYKTFKLIPKIRASRYKNHNKLPFLD